ncbi:hypothetical protein HAX54_004287 [Datura stramonium]|uniref:Uncharacterized protein n=1 Tax=Datura stramonium TaxID=4076 RepID=A0ABS8WUU8_DATST|nr:hypothetical protein [Datura stramonium]
MKPVVEKLSNLCGRVEMPEEEVNSLRVEIDKRKKIDDWWVGDSPSGNATSEVPQEVEQPPNEARILSDICVLALPHLPLTLPPNPLMPSIDDIASRNFS